MVAKLTGEFDSFNRRSIGFITFMDNDSNIALPLQGGFVVLN